MRSGLLFPLGLGLVLALGVPLTADAQGRGNQNGGPPAHASANSGGNSGANRVANPSTGHCPPGLANRNPPCVPPGQARQRAADHIVIGGERISIGDIIAPRDRRYTRITEPGRYGLNSGDNWRYVQRENYALLLDPQTRQILEITRIADAFLR